MGDTWWNWSKRGIKFESFRRLADDRAAKGFTVGQIFFTGNDGLLNRTYDLPDVEQIRRVEQFIAYANSKGITVWIHPWWSRQRLNQTIEDPYGHILGSFNSRTGCSTSVKPGRKPLCGRVHSNRIAPA